MSLYVDYKTAYFEAVKAITAYTEACLDLNRQLAEVRAAAIEAERENARLRAATAEAQAALTRWLDALSPFDELAEAHAIDNAKRVVAAAAVEGGQ